MTNVNDVIKIAQNEIGYLEKCSCACLDDKTANAGSCNYTKYWRDLKPDYQGQAWCNAFVNWIFVKAYGEKDAKKLLCTDCDWSYYTPTSASYFKNKKQWYTCNPKVGDIIYFKNSERIHHVGIVYKVDSTKVYTIEGNTSCGNEVIPNGGGVYAKSYSLYNKNIAGYGRPKYAAQQIIDVCITCGREGLTIVGATTLNVRSTPIDGEIVCSYKCGEKVQCTGKTLASDGTYWFHTDKGYISGKYVQGWILESCDKWWYVKQGYKYDSNAVVKIDGKQYIFDKDGWMLTPDRLNTDGSIKY